MERTFTFGKYKGKDIKYIILTHVGYIMWALENISGFCLNDEEQVVYDAVATAVRKYKVKTSFPQDKLFAYIKNVKDFKSLNTPFIIKEGNILTIRIDNTSPFYNYIKKYIPKRNKLEYINDTDEMLHSLAHEIAKQEMDYGDDI